MISDNSKSNNYNGFFDRLINSLKGIFLKKNPSKSTIYNPEAYDTLDTSQKDMIKGIFDMEDLNAKDIMIPRVDTVAVDSKTNLKQLVSIVVKAGHSRLPVYKETIDNIIGILYVKDLIRLLVGQSKKFQLTKILHTPFFVPETMPLKELLYEFRNRKSHLAIVVDEYGGVGGIITMEDILEEIVGEIQDEYDSDELPEIEKKGENSYELDPRLTITEFNEKLSLNLPTGEFDTIGGFILDLFGKIPKEKEVIKFQNIKFKIKEINGTVINRIRISIL